MAPHRIADSDKVRAMFSGPRDSIDFSTVRRALVVKLRHHGDVLLTSPVFTALKSHAPHASIDALVYSDTADMLTGHPAIEQVHGIGRQWKELSAAARLSHEWKLFSTLRSRQYDLLIHLSEHPRGAWLSRALGVRHAVAPNISSKPNFWKKSFTHRFAQPLNARRHMVEWNLDALRRLGLQPAPEDRQLMLVAGAKADAAVEQRLQALGLDGQAFIHLHPASRWEFKCWPTERTARLINALQARGLRVVMTAAPSEDERLHVTRILSQTEQAPVNLCGELSLKEMAALSARAALFVGVDSAPMHIAAAMGTPVVALFGPSGEAQWGPWMVPHRVVSSADHPCRPCGIDGCGGGKVSDCLVTLPESRVLAAIDELLAARSS